MSLVARSYQKKLSGIRISHQVGRTEGRPKLAISDGCGEKFSLPLSPMLRGEIVTAPRPEPERGQKML
jgi:hypothetical protein